MMLGALWTFLAQYGGGGNGSSTGGGGGGGYSLGYWIVVAVIAVAVIGLAVWVARWMRTRRGARTAPASGPRRIDRAA
jgi:hypothetical protein